MTYPLFARVVLTQDLPEENLVAGDIGTTVEHHPATADYAEGYEVEFFAGSGDTFAVVSIPAALLRAVTRKDILHARQSQPVIL